MAQREKGGRVIFIGNIPYGVSEQQICEIFGRVDPVVSFRLVYDKETGRPKGFGFLEYSNVDAAASAVRNLNGHDIMGRTLKVDYSNDNSGGSGGSGPRGQNQQSDEGQQQSGGSGLPPLPPGQSLPAGLTAPDAISQTLAHIPPPQLLDFISQMKTLVTADPASAATLLNSAPQLTYATFQALLLLGLVDTNVIGSLIQHAVPQPAAAPAPLPPPPASAAQYAPPAAQQFPPSYAQPAQFPGYAQPGYNPTPPVSHPAYQPPPPPQQPAPAAAAAPATSPDQAALIQQLMAMTREQIFALDETTRNTVLQLRQQYGAPVA